VYFSPFLLHELKPITFRIPEHELKVRKDLRGDRVFTIDPSTAKDLDDAVSVKVNEDGTYDVGVHISDVSFFVKANSALDRDARKRATSVYLVQRAVPMLPPTLSEQICSLVPGQERLTFSVIFTMNKDAQIQNKWFGKTIIKWDILVIVFAFCILILFDYLRSAAKLAYADAQNVIEGKSLGDVAVAPEHSASDIEHDVRILEDLAGKLKARRFENGTLALESPRLSFELDESGLPTDCSRYEQNDANALIREVSIVTFWMLDQITHL
jgi:protein SSD1